MGFDGMLIGGRRSQKKSHTVMTTGDNQALLPGGDTNCAVGAESASENHLACILGSPVHFLLHERSHFLWGTVQTLFQVADLNSIVMLAELF